MLGRQRRAVTRSHLGGLDQSGLEMLVALLRQRRALHRVPGAFLPHPQPTVADSFLCRSERIRAFSTLLNRTTVSWRSRSSARSPSSMSGLRQPLHPAIQIKASGENPSFGEYLATAVFHAIADLLLVNIQCL